MLIDNRFKTFEKIKRHIDNKSPMPLIRLVDGEGSILGYPALHSEEQIRSYYQLWFGNIIL